MDKCFKILDLEKPKIRGIDQLEVDTRLQEWKDSILKTAFRKKAAQVHPDKNPEFEGAALQFQEAKDAYEHIRKELKIQLRKTHRACTVCKTPRTPKTANFCHHCGFCYVEDPFEAKLRELGVFQHVIDRCRQDGSLTTLKNLPPTSVAFAVQISVLKMRQS